MRGRLLRRLRDIAMVRAEGVVTPDVAEAALASCRYDAEAIRAMLASLPDADPAKARLVRIRDTLSLGTLEVSAALAAEVAAHPALQPLGQAQPMPLDGAGNLTALSDGK